MNDVGYVYRAFAEDGALLYVGVTIRPSARFSAHERSADWWTQVVTLKIERFSSKEEAWAAEGRAIASERPAFNRHVPRHPLTAEEAYQLAERRRGRGCDRPTALAAVASTTRNASEIDLVALRLSLGHTIRSASFAIDIARGTLEAAERGDGLHPASAKKIADFYGISVVDIPHFRRRVAA